MSTGLFTHESCYRHITGPLSPDSPDRITAIEERLVASGLDSAFKHIQTERQALVDDLLRAHDQEYIDHVHSLIPNQKGVLAHISEDTIVSSDSWTAALESAGCVLEALDAVVDGRLTNAFCCVRPPGHHAHRRLHHQKARYRRQRRNAVVVRQPQSRPDRKNQRHIVKNNVSALRHNLRN